jgi:hypothetical protein
LDVPSTFAVNFIFAPGGTLLHKSTVQHPCPWLFLRFFRPFDLSCALFHTTDGHKLPKTKRSQVRPCRYQGIHIALPSRKSLTHVVCRKYSRIGSF